MRLGQRKVRAGKIKISQILTTLENGKLTFLLSFAFGGIGLPSGPIIGGSGKPANFAKFEGVREVASAGGGRPVILARSVRIHRRRVKIPKMLPRVVFRVENCSATETMAEDALAGVS